MLEALFGHFVRGLYEPLWGCFLAGFGWFCFNHWKKNRRETCLFLGVVLFMILWRVLMPINADRYVLILVPAAIGFSVYFLRELIFAMAPANRMRCLVLLLLLLLSLELYKSFHRISEDRHMFAMLITLQNDAAARPGPVCVAANRDVTCFLPKKFKVKTMRFRHLKKVNKLAKEPDYYLFKINPVKDAAPLKSYRNLTVVKEVPPERPKGSGFRLWKRK